MRLLYLTPLILSCASLSAIDVFVSSGSFSGSYYDFFSDSNGNIPVTELDINEEYTFYRLNDAPSHPFYVSDVGVNATSSSNIVLTGSGSATSGISGSQSFTLNFTGLQTTDTLYFYCSSHGFMTGTFDLVSASFPQIGSSDLFEIGQNPSYPHILTTTLKNTDLQASQLAQKVQINFTENGLPEGASYRIYRTTANGGNFTTGPFLLNDGTNTIDIPAVSFNRTVKIQFSAESGGASFDQLAVNSESLYGSEFPSEETLDIPDGSVSTSTLFTSSANSGHPYLYESASATDGSSSQDQQIFSLNVTALPENGATYRVYKTYNNGQGDLTEASPLTLGSNTISVNSVSFDTAEGRTVRLLISDHVGVDEFSVNGIFYVGEDDGSSTSVVAPAGSELVSQHFNIYSGTGAYEYVYTSTTTSEGIASQGQQVFSFNVTALPENGASYSVYKTTANGNDFIAQDVSLNIGPNVITVNSVTFDRTVKLRLTSNLAVDELVVNGTYLVGSDGSPFAAPVGSELASDYFDTVSDVDSNYEYVYESANILEGISSQAQQVFAFNVTALPENGAAYSTYKTTANGNDYTTNDLPLVLGANQITVTPVSFDRTVKLRLTADVALDELVVNGTYLVGSAPAGPPGGSTYPEGTFSAASGAVWPWVYAAATIAQGEISREAKTFVLNVTELPEGGADYRIYKTTANGSDYFAPAKPLNIGVNKFTVPSTSFNRAVKLQLSSGNIAFEYFGVNGTDVYGDALDSDSDGVDDFNDYDPSDPSVQVEPPSEAPSLAISTNGIDVTIQWSDASGFEVQSSNDLETWSSTGDSESPYTESLGTAKFYKLSND